MDRMEEYQALMEYPVPPPPTLEHTLTRARARKRRARTLRFCGVPLASLAGVFTAFVLLVNTSLPFAVACGGVPMLKGLTAAVAFSPSLKEAVERDFVQYVGQRQTVEGLTMVIDYIIADKKQANLFYHFEGSDLATVAGTPRVTAVDGTPLESYGLQGGGWNDAPGEIGKITLDFTDRDMPAALRLTYGVERVERSRGEEALSGPAAPQAERVDDGEFSPPPILFSFTFDLTFDPAAIAQGEVLEIGQWIVLDGQRILVERAEIYPTHLRVILADDPANTAYLKDLTFYIEDENGRRNEPISNGISGTGTAGSPSMGSLYQESTFFWRSERLTLHITGAEWLDKDRRYVQVDLETGAAEGLPDGISLTVEREGDLAVFTVRAPQFEENHHYQVMTWSYLDPAGTEHQYHSASSTIGAPGGGEDPGFFYEQFQFPVYDWPFVQLELVSNRRGDLSEPVRLRLK